MSQLPSDLPTGMNGAATGELLTLMTTPSDSILSNAILTQSRST